MIVGSRPRLNKINNDLEIELGGNNIKRVKETKTLGVIVDDQLNWQTHLDSIVTKVSKGIGMIRRMKAFVPQMTLISVYNAIILPHFDYCSLVWDTCSNYLLEKLQNRAARVITGKSYEVRSDDILRELNWQPLVERRNDNKAVFMYKIKNGEYLANISDILNVANNQAYRLRSNNTWNDLPRSLKASNVSLGQFKALLRDRCT